MTLLLKYLKKIAPAIDGKLAWVWMNLLLCPVTLDPPPIGNLSAHLILCVSALDLRTSSRLNGRITPNSLNNSRYYPKLAFRLCLWKLVSLDKWLHLILRKEAIQFFSFRTIVNFLTFITQIHSVIVDFSTHGY